MAHLDRLSGNEAVAVAMRQIDPDVMGAFPITPSTEIPQYFAQYVADADRESEGKRLCALCPLWLHQLYQRRGYPQ